MAIAGKSFTYQGNNKFYIIVPVNLNMVMPHIFGFLERYGHFFLYNYCLYKK